METTVDVINRIDMLDGYNLISLEDINMIVIFKNKESILALLACSAGMYNMSFFTPVLSTHLRKQYDMSDSWIGICYILASFPYAIATITTPICFKTVPRKLQFVICFFVSTLAFALMGPSKMLGFPDHVALFAVGFFILGFI